MALAPQGSPPCTEEDLGCMDVALRGRVCPRPQSGAATPGLREACDMDTTQQDPVTRNMRDPPRRRCQNEDEGGEHVPALVRAPPITSGVYAQDDAARMPATPLARWQAARRMPDRARPREASPQDPPASREQGFTG